MSEDTKDIGNIWATLKEFRAWTEGKFNELRVILIGATGDNGMQGKLREVTARVDVIETEIERLEKWGHDTVNELWHEKRHKECYGLPAVESLKQAIDQRFLDLEKHAVEMRKSRRAMITAIVVAVIASASELIKVVWPLVGHK